MIADTLVYDSAADPETFRVSTGCGLDFGKVRSDFPALAQKVHGKHLVYLDSAASAQKPRAVIDALHRATAVDCANIHRGVHVLSERATASYDAARKSVQRFINAKHAHEIIFVRGTTEAINLVAHSFGHLRFEPGDEILISHLEHHSNIVPWQLVCEYTGASLKVVPINDAGELMLDAYEAMISDRTRLVAMAHVSNALGTVNPVKEICDIAHRRGVPVLIDGAQAVPHMAVDVQQIGCDFYAFSGHKLYGPTGVGVLYGREELLDTMPPYQGGGDMIESVSFEKTTYNELPYKFEAGTPNIAGVIGLGAAVDYVSSLDVAAVARHDKALVAYATAVLQEVDGLKLIGTSSNKSAVLSFVMEGIHPHDIGTVLDAEGVAIRTGHHCAQPVMQRFGVPATARASVAVYNSTTDLDVLVEALKTAKRIFGPCQT